MNDTNSGIIETVANGVEFIAFGILVLGLLFSVIVSARVFRETEGHWSDRLSGPFLIRLRVTLGRWLLAGLEVLIISDVLHSIVHRTLNDVGILAGIVVIRVVLAYFLDIEIARLPALDEERGEGDRAG